MSNVSKTLAEKAKKARVNSVLTGGKAKAVDAHIFDKSKKKPTKKPTKKA